MNPVGQHGKQDGSSINICVRHNEKRSRRKPHKQSLVAHRLSVKKNKRKKETTNNKTKGKVKKNNHERKQSKKKKNNNERKRNMTKTKEKNK